MPESPAAEARNRSGILWRWDGEGVAAGEDGGAAAVAAGERGGALEDHAEGAAGGGVGELVRGGNGGWGDGGCGEIGKGDRRLEKA